MIIRDDTGTQIISGNIKSAYTRSRGDSGADLVVETEYDEVWEMGKYDSWEEANVALEYFWAQLFRGAELIDMKEQEDRSICSGLSDWILSERSRQGLTQMELAKRSGVAASSISGLERGQFVPNVYTVEHIIMGLGYELRIVKKGRDGS